MIWWFFVSENFPCTLCSQRGIFCFKNTSVEKKRVNKWFWSRESGSCSLHELNIKEITASLCVLKNSGLTLMGFVVGVFLRENNCHICSPHCSRQLNFIMKTYLKINTNCYHRHPGLHFHNIFSTPVFCWKQPFTLA